MYDGISYHIISHAMRRDRVSTTQQLITPKKKKGSPKLSVALDHVSDEYPRF